MTDESWVVAMVVHPKKARELDDERAYRLETLLKAGKLWVFGEVGLVFSMGAPRPQIQISTLRWFLAVASQGGVPVVLHVRGSKDKVHSAQAKIQCMRQCMAPYPPTLFRWWLGASKIMVGHFPRGSLRIYRVGENLQ